MRHYTSKPLPSGVVAKESQGGIQNDKTEQKPKRTQEEQDAALIAAYREKFGGDITATFEDGQATEMKRGVRKNMFRCK